MNIGIDFDDTITRDKPLWKSFISAALTRGHKVYIVTWRDEAWGNEVVAEFGSLVTGVYCTAMKAKEAFMFDAGIIIDVWIDDNVRAITADGQTYSASGVWQ